MFTITTPEQFAAANKASVDAMLTLANTALASAERIAALNLNTARSMLEDGVANAKAMLGAKVAQEFFSVQRLRWRSRASKNRRVHAQRL